MLIQRRNKSLDDSLTFDIRFRVTNSNRNPISFSLAPLRCLHFSAFKRSLGQHPRFKQAIPHGSNYAKFSWPFAGEEPAPALLIGAVFALVMELGRRRTKRRLNPKRSELTRPAEHRFEEYFGCPVKYRAPRNALILRAADVELPFATHNDELLQMLAPQFEQELKEGRTKQSIVGQVKWVLKRLLAGSRPDLFMVAKELGMSERTLATPHHGRRNHLQATSQ